MQRRVSAPPFILPHALVTGAAAATPVKCGAMLNRAATLSAALAASILALGLAASAGPALARTPAPVVAELYTSQGCSACGAADDLAAGLEGKKGVLTLTFPVDYWDYLGWRDTFAQPAFTDRQKAYAKALGVREVYTPQLVVNGMAQIGKSQKGASLIDSADELIGKAAKARPRGPTVRLLSHGRVQVSAGHAPRGGAEVWLVRYQAAPAEVAVTSGENRGKSVRYRNVVRELERLGGWTGKSRTYAEPQASEGDLKTVVLVQAKSGGRILAVIAP